MESHIHEVEFDVPAKEVKRITVSFVKAAWYPYLHHSLGPTFRDVLFAIAVWYLASDYAGYFSERGLLIVVIFATVMGLPSSFLQALKEAKNYDHPDYRGKYVISPQGFNYSLSSGITHSIPWKNLSLSRSSNDAWVLLIDGDGEFFVFREPFRQRGLEELFESLISQPPQDTTIQEE